MVLGLIIVMVMGQWEVLWPNTWQLQRLVMPSVVVGIIVVGMWCFNLISYKKGASIVLKKLVMSATYLITTMLMGVWCFSEKMTVGKKVGAVLYLAAFCLMDDGTWKYIRSVGRSDNLEHA